MKTILKLIAKYSHLRCTLFILIVALIALVLSFFIQNPDVKSIMQNVFAGLITGIVITLIGSIKGKEIKELEFEKQLLNELDSRFSDYYKAYFAYFRCHDSDDEEYEKAVRDVMERLTSIYTYISEMNKSIVFTSILKKKATEYFVTKGELNLDNLQNIYNKFNECLRYPEKSDQNLRNKIDKIIRIIDEPYDEVRNTVKLKLFMIKIREYELMKSII